MKSILNIIILSILLSGFWLSGFWPLPRLEAADQTVTLFLTANLNGRFAISANNQDQADPMLLLAQSIVWAQKNQEADLYIDLGNAFYPGVLSRFSFGSVMMDYLDYFGYDATLVSSKDLKLGVSNLAFLDQRKSTRLLSANVIKNGKTVFEPYFTATIDNQKIAFIGITSLKSLLDIAEKQLFSASIKTVQDVMPDILKGLEAQGVDAIVLLSGLSSAENIKLLKKYSKIALCISGGDAPGDLYGTGTTQVVLESGQAMVNLNRFDGYYLLTLDANEALKVKQLQFKFPAYTATENQDYVAFTKRLKLWKSNFATFSNETLAEDIKETIRLDGTKIAQLLRHRYGTEVALIEKNAVISGTLPGRITYFDIISMVNNEFPILIYRLSGKELKDAANNNKELLTIGMEEMMVQSQPISDNQVYLICSTQSVYDKISKQIDREIPHQNTWKTISDEIREDLKGPQIIKREDFTYLDDRFRCLMDVYLSNFFHQASVSRDENDDVPIGNPEDTYSKWGMENKLDVTVYNQRHQIVITPYIYYIRQNDDYLRNLLRGTLLYTYNLKPDLKPYFKSQLDTVVKKVEDLRPFEVRETIGFFFQINRISGKMGLGFEKKMQDPTEDLISGLETIVDAKFDLLETVTYSLNLDTFYGARRYKLHQEQIHMEITNALSFKLNSFMTLSAKHKWYYYDTPEYEKRYKDSQTILSLDLQKEFKMF